MHKSIINKRNDFEVLFIECIEDDQNHLCSSIENHTDTGILSVEIPRNEEKAVLDLRIVGPKWSCHVKTT
jgi:hypothetical protein